MGRTTGSGRARAAVSGFGFLPALVPASACPGSERWVVALAAVVVPSSLGAGAAARMALPDLGQHEGRRGGVRVAWVVEVDPQPAVLAGGVGPRDVPQFCPAYVVCQGQAGEGVFEGELERAEPVGGAPDRRAGRAGRDGRAGRAGRDGRDGRGDRVDGGRPWCSRRRVLRQVRARGGEDEGSQGIDGVGGSSSAGGISPDEGGVGVQPDAPAEALLDAVVPAAQADEVGGRGGAGRPRSDVVEVAEAGVDVATGEAAVPVALPDQRGDAFARPIAGAGGVVEQGAGDRGGRCGG